jgi:ornithine cyclodeaminase/alanine dehydrogenase-like protein (mu-crystallin family)
VTQVQEPEAPGGARGKSPIFLSAPDLDALGLSTTDVADAIEAAIRAQVAGTLKTAPKAYIQPGDGRMALAMLGVDADVVVVKALVANAANKARGLPSVLGSVLVLDGQTGQPLALLDGAWVTAVRTAGLSAVAARRLARADSASLGLIGCGVQAHSHLAAFGDMFPLRRVLVAGRGAANRDAVLAAVRARGLEAVAVDAEAALAADIVVTSVDMGVAPFLDARHLRPGAFASMVDLAVPWLESGLSGFDRIAIDDLPQERQAAKPMVPLARVGGDLADLVTGRMPPRLNETERTGFAFRGIALGDIALAGLVWRRLR